MVWLDHDSRWRCESKRSAVIVIIDAFNSRLNGGHFMPRLTLSSQVEPQETEEDSTDMVLV